MTFLSNQVTNVYNNYSLDTSGTVDQVLYVHTSKNPITITLDVPQAGRQLVIMDADGYCGWNNIKVIAPAFGTIDGAGGMLMCNNWQSNTLIGSLNGSWFIQAGSFLLLTQLISPFPPFNGSATGYGNG